VPGPGPGPRGRGDGLSFTEFEFDTAGEAGRPRLVFLLDESVATVRWRWPTSTAPDDRFSPAARPLADMHIVRLVAGCLDTPTSTTWESLDDHTQATG
jgi:hypothetical protein